jgi:hypothetical protein
VLVPFGTIRKAINQKHAEAVQLWVCLYHMKTKFLAGHLLVWGMICATGAVYAGVPAAVGSPADSLPAPVPTPEPATIVIGLSGFGAFLMLNRFFRR